MSLIKPCIFTDNEILSLSDKVPTPFHLYDEATIRKNCQEMKTAFAWAPSFKNYFAVKATPNPHILRICQEEGCGADCSSLAELKMVEALGMRGEDIMFTSNNTPLEEYKKASELNAILNLDDISHIDFLQTSGVGIPEYISFRYNPGPDRTGNIIIGEPQEAKFGVTADQLGRCYVKAREYGARRFALHTMVVSNCLDETELVETARMLFHLVIVLKAKHDIRIEMVDLGGGIGIPYRPEDQSINMKSLGEKIHSLYDSMIVPAGLAPLRLTYECGRCITGNAGVVVTRVTHQKNIYKKYICVDACMANLMRPGLYRAYHHITVIKDDNPSIMKSLPKNRSIFENAEKNVITKFDVVGGLCENNDKFAIDRPLPLTIRIGDLLVIHDTGAHGHSMGFNYNGKLRSAEYLKLMVNQQKSWWSGLYSSGPPSIVPEIVEIRRRETVDDLFATLDWNMKGKECTAKQSPFTFMVGLVLGALAFRALSYTRPGK